MPGSKGAYSAAIAFLAFAAILASRHPAILTSANFWAEDGALWYPQARALGLHALWQPSTGYLQATSRLVALLCQVLPVRLAPLGFALIALAIQALPPTFLVSGRLGGAWRDRRGRVLAACALVALPNATEVFANVTNAHWHLALLAFLVLVADPPTTRFAGVFDSATLLLSGLSGPFCILLAPVAIWQVAARPSRTAAWRLALLLACAAVQVACLVRVGNSRPITPLGASADLLGRIVALQVILGPLLGPAGLAAVLRWHAWHAGILPVAVCVGAGALTSYALALATPILRQFCLFAALVLAASLLHPMADMVRPQWPVMPLPLAAQRYWFIPMLAWVGVLLSLLAAPRWPARILAAALLGLLAWHVPGEWRAWTYGDPPGFAAAARRFEASAPGTHVSFPIRPEGWHMTLVR